MAGFVDTKEAEILDCYFNGTNITAPTNVYIKWHLGDPGEAGTANAAVETTRKEVTFSAASGGAITSDNAPSWTNVAASEDYTHFSIHSHLTNSTPIFTGTVTMNPATAGDTVTVAAGDVDLTLD